jgi:cation:H+ antiporter
VAIGTSHAPEKTMNLKPWLPFLIAGAVAVPGIFIRLMGYHYGPETMAVTSGVAILGASFLLLWACDAAQADVSQSLALAAVALFAVLPEYAVDMYFTWMAGRQPESDYAHYAVANMTGANRLLIGVAWGAIAVIFWFRQRRAIRLGNDRRLEMIFLAMATAYAFVIPIKQSLAWYDGLVFLGLYVWYIWLAGKRPASEFEAEGPAEALVRLPKVTRRIMVALVFCFAGGAILANAEPFCEGLVNTGKALQINEFFLVQWLAPIASEAPEFVVALVFAWRGQPSLALGSLLSSKLNQWTLLVGMIPGVFALSHGSLDHPIPMGQFQMNEILLTAAQSLLAVLMLASMRFSVWGALLLFTLFSGQLILPPIVERVPALSLGIPPDRIHELFAILYVVAAVIVLARKPWAIWGLRKGLRADQPPAVACDIDEPAKRDV